MVEKKKPVKKQVKSAQKKAVTAQKSTAAKKVTKTKENLEDTGILVEAALNIEAKAKTVSDFASGMAKDVAGKTSQITEDVIKKARKTITEVYDVSSKAVDDLQQSAQDYIDRFKNSVEIKKESAAREKLATKLGTLVFKKYQGKDFKPEILFEQEQVVKLVKEIQTLDKKIVAMGKKLDKK